MFKVVAFNGGEHGEFTNQVDAEQKAQEISGLRHCPMFVVDAKRNQTLAGYRNGKRNHAKNMP